MSIIQPGWVYRLIDGLATYEDEHASTRDGGICLGNLYELVPHDVRRDAAVFMEGVRAAIQERAAAVEGQVDVDPQRHPRGEDVPEEGGER